MSNGMVPTNCGSIYTKTWLVFIIAGNKKIGQSIILHRCNKKQPTNYSVKTWLLQVAVRFWDIPLKPSMCFGRWSSFWPRCRCQGTKKIQLNLTKKHGWLSISSISDINLWLYFSTLLHSKWHWSQACITWGGSLNAIRVKYKGTKAFRLTLTQGHGCLHYGSGFQGMYD